MTSIQCPVPFAHQREELLRLSEVSSDSHRYLVFFVTRVISEKENSCQNFQLFISLQLEMFGLKPNPVGSLKSQNQG